MLKIVNPHLLALLSAVGDLVMNCGYHGGLYEP